MNYIKDDLLLLYDFRNLVLIDEVILGIKGAGFTAFA